MYPSIDKDLRSNLEPFEAPALFLGITPPNRPASKLKDLNPRDREPARPKLHPDEHDVTASIPGSKAIHIKGRSGLRLIFQKVIEKGVAKL